MKKCFLLACAVCAYGWVEAATVEISSPDKKLVVAVSDDGGRPSYTVSYDGVVFLEQSPLGLRTNVGGEIAYMSGYESFALFTDHQDISHYGAAFLIVSLILACVLFLPAGIGLLGEEKYLPKSSLSTIGIGIAKLVCEIIVTILFSQTETNIELSFGSYLVPSLTALFLFLFLVVYVNFRNSEKTIFENKKQED